MSTPAVWYSYLYGDVINRSYKEPWGHGDNGRWSTSRTLGKRYYELTDHLGNVLATVMDRKTGHVNSSIPTLYDYYNPDVVSATDYYPGGMPMGGRSVNGEKFRFGSQNQLKDAEIYGEGESYAFKYRMEDARLNRFWSVDPLAAKYPYYSPYAFSGNRLIDMIELEGLEPNPATQSSQWIQTARLYLHTAADALYKTAQNIAPIRMSTPEEEKEIRQNGWTQTYKDVGNDLLHLPSNLKKAISSTANTMANGTGPQRLDALIQTGGLIFAISKGKNPNNLFLAAEEGGNINKVNAALNAVKSIVFPTMQLFEKYERHIFSADHLKNGIMDLGASRSAIMQNVVHIVNENMGALEEGQNFILTKMNGHDATIKLFVKDGTIISIDAHKELAKRAYGKIIQN